MRPGSRLRQCPSGANCCVETVDLVVEGQEGLLLNGLHGDLVRAAAQLRKGRSALAAFSSTSLYSRCSLFRGGFPNGFYST